MTWSLIVEEIRQTYGLENRNSVIGHVIYLQITVNPNILATSDLIIIAIKANSALIIIAIKAKKEKIKITQKKKKKEKDRKIKDRK